MICAGCKADTRRVTVTMTDRDGRLLPEDQRTEICPSCAPERFRDVDGGIRWAGPADKKVWMEHEALPHLYHYKPDGTLELNDSPKADLLAEFENTRDEDEAIARKRATRRTEPSTPEEIAALNAYWTPIIQQRIEDERRQIEGDELYTQNLIERRIKEDHDRQLQESVN